MTLLMLESLQPAVINRLLKTLVLRRAVSADFREIVAWKKINPSPFF